MSYPKKKNDGIYDAYLAHHGILGMHWGVRRYQNKDGSLTEAGKARLRKTTKFEKKFRFKNQLEEIYRHADNFTEDGFIKGFNRKSFAGATKGDQKALDNLRKSDEKTIELYNKHLRKLKEAKIKDLKLKNTEQTKKFIDELIEDDILRMYKHTDSKGKAIYRVLSKSDTDYEKRSGVDTGEFVDIKERQNKITNSMKENKQIRKKLLAKNNLTDDDKEMLELMDMEDEDSEKELKELKNLRRY